MGPINMENEMIRKGFLYLKKMSNITVHISSPSRQELSQVNNVINFLLMFINSVIDAYF
jgi:hypothetical protein